MLDYWRLPGPSAFIADAQNEIASGRNLIFLLPANEPYRLIDKLYDVLSDRWSIQLLDNENDLVPLRAICACTLGESGVSSIVTADALAADERLTGTIVIVSGVKDGQLGGWRKFIQGYEVACRRMPADRRMLIVLALKGEHTSTPPTPEVALAVLRWNDFVGEVDMQVYATLRLRNMSMQPRKRLFLATCLARLALWDVTIIDRFCERDPELILDPINLLLEMGTERGWKDLRQPTWENGATHKVDGADQLHSAYLACHDRDSIYRRLWGAQASVLLPIIEESRTALLPRVKRYVSFPIKTNTGTVERLEDLEVGHMLWQLNASGAELSLIRTVTTLKRARDSLAHLKPLPKEMCFHSDLIG